MLLSSVSLLLANNVFAEKIAADEQFETYFHTGLILHQLPIMTIGVILYYIVRKIRVGQLNCWKVLLESGIITMLVSGAFFVLHMNKKYMTSSLIAGLMFGCLFLVCNCIGGEIWKKKVFTPIECIGKHSYGIYCFHQIVINCVFTLLVKNNSLLLWLVTFIITVALSCGIGIGGELIEEKIRIRMKNYGKRT